LTRERLERAAIVVSIAPARRFSRTERRRIYEFLEAGGLFICTVGAEEASASRSLWEDFGIRVPISPVPTVGRWREPEPIGRIRSLYLNASDYGRGDYKVGVMFHAGWPVEAEISNADVLVRAHQERPIAVSRAVGRGHLVVIGDTGFAMNKNLEYIGGEPFEGRYENAHFFRWLIARITDRQEWFPPPSEDASSGGGEQEAQP
jgi:hypothetical protein